MSRQHGFTLIELMVSSMLGLLVALTAGSLLVSGKSVFLTLDEQTAMQDSARQALATMTRAVRQAAWRDWALQADGDGPGSGVAGLDAHSLRTSDEAMHDPLPPAVNASDVLALRFMGAGKGSQGDGTMLNCAGFGVPADAGNERGWSIFYVAAGAGGEPELRCKYRGRSSWRSEALVRGVESFQVLYGIDSDADGLPNHFANATRINQLDNESRPDPEDEEHTADENAETGSTSYWSKVVAVRIAMLLRSSRSVRQIGPASDYHLFGEDYSLLHAGSDPGTRISEAGMPDTVRRRLRKLSSVTIMLRNAPAGSAL